MKKYKNKIITIVFFTLIIFTTIICSYQRYLYLKKITYEYFSHDLYISNLCEINNNNSYITDKYSLKINFILFKNFFKEEELYISLNKFLKKEIF